MFQNCNHQAFESVYKKYSPNKTNLQQQAHLNIHQSQFQQNNYLNYTNHSILDTFGSTRKTSRPGSQLNDVNAEIPSPFQREKVSLHNTSLDFATAAVSSLPINTQNNNIKMMQKFRLNNAKTEMRKSPSKRSKSPGSLQQKFGLKIAKHNIQFQRNYPEQISNNTTQNHSIYENERKSAFVQSQRGSIQQESGRLPNQFHKNRKVVSPHKQTSLQPMNKPDKLNSSSDILMQMNKTDSHDRLVIKHMRNNAKYFNSFRQSPQIYIRNNNQLMGQIGGPRNYLNMSPDFINQHNSPIKQSLKQGKPSEQNLEQIIINRLKDINYELFKVIPLDKLIQKAAKSNKKGNRSPPKRSQLITKKSRSTLNNSSLTTQSNITPSNGRATNDYSSVRDSNRNRTDLASNQNTADALFNINLNGNNHTQGSPYQNKRSKLHSGEQSPSRINEQKQAYLNDELFFQNSQAKDEFFQENANMDFKYDVQIMFDEYNKLLKEQTENLERQKTPTRKSVLSKKNEKLIYHQNHQEYMNDYISNFEQLYYQKLNTEKENSQAKRYQQSNDKEDQELEFNEFDAFDFQIISQKIQNQTRKQTK